MRIVIHLANAVLILLIVQLFFSDWVWTRVRGKSPQIPLMRLPRVARFSIGLVLGMLISFGIMGLLESARKDAPPALELAELSDITRPAPSTANGAPKTTDPVSISIESKGGTLVEERTLRDGTVWRRVDPAGNAANSIAQKTSGEVVVDGGHRSGSQTKSLAHPVNRRTNKAVYPTREIQGARIGRIPAHAEVTLLSEYQSFVEVSYSDLNGWIAQADLE